MKSAIIEGGSKYRGNTDEEVINSRQYLQMGSQGEDRCCRSGELLQKDLEGMGACTSCWRKRERVWVGMIECEGYGAVLGAPRCSWTRILNLLQ